MALDRRRIAAAIALMAAERSPALTLRKASAAARARWPMASNSPSVVADDEIVAVDKLIAASVAQQGLYVAGALAGDRSSFRG